jgi:hypothetical protein
MTSSPLSKLHDSDVVSSDFSTIVSGVELLLMLFVAVED